MRRDENVPPLGARTVDLLRNEYPASTLRQRRKRARVAANGKAASSAFDEPRGARCRIRGARSTRIVVDE